MNVKLVLNAAAKKEKKNVQIQEENCSGRGWQRKGQHQANVWGGGRLKLGVTNSLLIHGIL